MIQIPHTNYSIVNLDNYTDRKLFEEAHKIISDYSSRIYSKDGEIDELHSEIDMLHKDIIEMEVFGIERFNENNKLICQRRELKQTIARYKRIGFPLLLIGLISSFVALGINIQNM